MNAPDEGATVAPTNEGDPCITVDAEGHEKRGKHAWTWAPRDAVGNYFSHRVCTSCGKTKSGDRTE